GCEFVSSRHFPDEAQGRFLLNNTIGVLGVLQHRVRALGSGFEGEEIEPLVLCEDPNFRPVDLEFGPDGALYIADWQEALIGHMQYSIRDPLRDRRHGRIWRVTYPARPLLPNTSIAGESIEKLLELLRVPEDRTRIRAKQELATRPPAAVLAALARWLAALDPAEPNHQHLRTEALWVHQWFDVINLPLLTQQLASPEPLARAAATRVLCYWRDRVPAALDLLHARAKDPHPLVRLEAVRATSFFAGRKAVDVALEILNHETDYYLDYTLGETMRALAPSPADVSDPRGLQFILSRLSNAELAAAPGIESVWTAQVERSGMDAATRDTAIGELAKLRQSSREREIAAALVRMDERGRDTGAAAELGRLLAAAPRAELRQIEDTILRMSTKDHSLAAARRAGFAARVAMTGDPAEAWQSTDGSTDSRALLLDSIALLGDSALRAGFHPLVAALFTPDAPRLAANVRAAALRVLPLLGDDRASASFAILAAQLGSGVQRTVATRALLQLPRSAWNAAAAGELAASVLAYAQTEPAARRSSQEFVETLQLGQELANLLPPQDAAPLRRALRALGVGVFVVKAPREQMRYDVAQLVVEAGRPFEIIFENTDIMPHNMVVVTPGAREEIGMAAMTLGAAPDR
ncbi:MAG: dehydrogenase, partial [Verrucomicrobia bacterium]|nr:dehydrogenase [Verrucomicrobiota bacterium]